MLVSLTPGASNVEHIRVLYLGSDYFAGNYNGFFALFCMVEIGKFESRNCGTCWDAFVKSIFDIGTLNDAIGSRDLDLIIA